MPMLGPVCKLITTIPKPGTVKGGAGEVGQGKGQARQRDWQEPQQTGQPGISRQGPAGDCRQSGS